MTSSRTPGRYNLHRLGWAAFEDLCIQVMRVVLGETCTRFRPGADGGRDGWFSGTSTGMLVEQNQLTGDFVIQCKHTSSSTGTLSVAQMAGEIRKIRRLAAGTAVNYILMTNCRVTAPAEQVIRESIEGIPGVAHCLVLSETWIEDTLDAQPRLLRLVPRLYGVGDLSQIVSFTIEQQTRAVLDDLLPSLKTFVPTASYRSAETALHGHGFVVLVGPPASGKSAIAANLCMVSMAQDKRTRVLRIEHADQFKSTWTPSDQHTIYWVDDVFGETALDGMRLKEWSTALDKVEAARRRGARIIFCTRDYILVAAASKLKQARNDIINDARVRVDVTELPNEDKAAILYNHIKDGSITKTQKSKLKRFLPELVGLQSFSPELARRLGSARYTRGLPYDHASLRVFFNQPVSYFKDLVQGLAHSEMAALVLCLASNNSVSVPVTRNAAVDAVMEAYSVSLAELADAFDALSGSLVRQVRQGTKLRWELYHPSMLDALQSELADKPSKAKVYLRSAQLRVLFRDTTMVSGPATTRLVFIPDTLYPDLIDRIRETNSSGAEGCAAYLASRGSDQFLWELQEVAPAVIDQALAAEPDPNDTQAGPELAVRLFRLGGEKLLNAERVQRVREHMAAANSASGWIGFLKIDGIDECLPGFVDEFIEAEVSAGFPTVRAFVNWTVQGLSSAAEYESAIDSLDEHSAAIHTAIRSSTAVSSVNVAALERVHERQRDDLRESMARCEEREEARADHDVDAAMERAQYERHEAENGRFADVDE